MPRPREADRALLPGGRSAGTASCRFRAPEGREEVRARAGPSPGGVAGPWVVGGFPAGSAVLTCWRASSARQGPEAAALSCCPHPGADDAAGRSAPAGGTKGGPRPLFPARSPAAQRRHGRRPCGSFRAGAGPGIRWSRPRIIAEAVPRGGGTPGRKGPGTARWPCHGGRYFSGGRLRGLGQRLSARERAAVIDKAAQLAEHEKPVWSTFIRLAGRYDSYSGNSRQGGGQQP